jgi:hypothetical protein
MTITADSSPPRLKCDYDEGYDTAVKGTNVVVKKRERKRKRKRKTETEK